MKILRFFVPLYFFVLVALFLYSFTQVDLGLTLSKISIWQTSQKFFQYIGYFQRPLSTYLFIVILLLFFISYIFFLILSQKKALSKKLLWSFVFFTSIILCFSYNAFSYDLFNYIFDAKIITFYHGNPYQHKALDFFGDPMLSFMHWTHRVYPYGPLWLFLTVPLSFLGSNIFLVTFFLFKILTAFSYIGSVYFIYNIMKKVRPQFAESAVVFFAFNPLVVVESLVSAHNDIVMMAFAVGGIFYLITKRYGWAFFFLIFSIGIKFATVFLLPLVCLQFVFDKNKKPMQWEKFFLLSFACMGIALAVAIFRSTFQPWYLLYLFPLAALLAHKTYVRVPMIVISTTAVFSYVPFLYNGNWDPPIPEILNIMNGSGLSLAVLLGVYFFFKRNN